MNIKLKEIISQYFENQKVFVISFNQNGRISNVTCQKGNISSGYGQNFTCDDEVISFDYNNRHYVVNIDNINTIDVAINDKI